MYSYHTEKNEVRQTAPGVWCVYKHPGETLAVCTERFRSVAAITEAVPVTYAGRLDPMAEGTMIFLAGEVCKEKEAYTGLSKTYEVAVLFGVATDTYDMLGLVTAEALGRTPARAAVDAAVDQVVARAAFPYPPYASKPVDGVPLFVHARAGTLPAVLPEKDGIVRQCDVVSYEEQPFSVLVENAVATIRTVAGDFRQDAILAQWEELSREHPDTLCSVLTLRLTVSSGVYMRTIAHLIGETLGVPALAYSINRTSVQK